MGVVGWILLLLSQMMVPTASQKPPGLTVGVVMGQTRHVSDQQLRPPRRPEDPLDVSVVALRINQTDPKSVITQVKKCCRTRYVNEYTCASNTQSLVWRPRSSLFVLQGVRAALSHSPSRYRVCRRHRSGGHRPDPRLPLCSDTASCPRSPRRLLDDYGRQGECLQTVKTLFFVFLFFGVWVTVFVFWRLGSCNPSSQPPLNVRIIGNAS